MNERDNRCHYWGTHLGADSSIDIAIARGIKKVTGIRLSELREMGKGSGVMEGRQLFSLEGGSTGINGKRFRDSWRRTRLRLQVGS